MTQLEMMRINRMSQMGKPARIMAIFLGGAIAASLGLSGCSTNLVPPSASKESPQNQNATNGLSQSSPNNPTLSEENNGNAKTQPQTPVLKKNNIPKDKSVFENPSKITERVVGNKKVEVNAFVQHQNGTVEIKTIKTIGRARATKAAAQLQKFPGVLAVSVPSPLKVADTQELTPQVEPTPSNDTYRGQQWDMTQLRAETVWKYATGSGVTVAVLDSGAQTNHPDLTNGLVEGVDESINHYPTMRDTMGHGSHVSGTIVAQPGNSAGVVGLAPGAKVMPIRIFSDTGSTTTSIAAAGVNYAVSHGAKVINMSFVGQFNDAVFHAAIQNAVASNVTVVCAAGNERETGSGTPYPASYAETIGVAATDSSGNDAYYSSQGPFVDIAAPGSTILSTVPTSSYSNYSGTSMATPHISALVALILQVSPTKTPAQIKTLIEDNAVDLDTAGWDSSTGFGLMNAVATLNSLNPSLGIPGKATGVSLSSTHARELSVSWNLPNALIDPTGYMVEHESSANPNVWVVDSADTKTVDRTFTTTGVAGNLYRFRITSINASGKGVVSDPSNQVVAMVPALPHAVTNVVAASSQPSNVYLTWTPPSGDITSFKIERETSTNPGVWIVNVANVSARSTAASLSAVAGNSNRYRVTAVNDLGNGPASVESNWITVATFATPPNVSTVSAQSPDIGLARAVWTAPNSGLITGFKVEHEALTSPNVWVVDSANTQPDDRSYTVGAPNGAFYRFRVSSLNNTAASVTPIMSNWIMVKGVSNSNPTPTPPKVITKPGAVTGLAVSLTKTKSIAKWHAPSNRGNAAISYQIRLTKKNSNKFGSWRHTKNTSYSFSGLAKGKYKVQTRVTNQAGTSPVREKKFKR